MQRHHVEQNPIWTKEDVQKRYTNERLSACHSRTRRKVVFDTCFQQTDGKPPLRREHSSTADRE